MNQHQQISAEFERQYAILSDAISVMPSALAHAVFETFSTGEEEPHIYYTSLEYLKHMARVFLARRKDADEGMNESHAAQGDLDLGVALAC